MTARLLTGSKQEIASKLASLEGEVREAIVFVEEPSPAAPEARSDIFQEMEPLTVNVREVDDSREAIYSPVERD